MYTIYLKIILDILIALVYTIIVKGRRNRETDTPKKIQKAPKNPLTNFSKGDIIKVQKGEKSNSQTQLKLGCPLPK